MYNKQNKQHFCAVPYCVEFRCFFLVILCDFFYYVIGLIYMHILKQLLMIFFAACYSHRIWRHWFRWL